MQNFKEGETIVFRDISVEWIVCRWSFIIPTWPKLVYFAQCLSLSKVSKTWQSNTFPTDCPTRKIMPFNAFDSIILGQNSFSHCSL